MCARVTVIVLCVSVCVCVLCVDKSVDKWELRGLKHPPPDFDKTNKGMTIKKTDRVPLKFQNSSK